MDSIDISTTIIGIANIIMTIGIFISTISINKKATSTQDKVNEINMLVSNELEIKKEATIISLDKSRDAFSFLDSMLEGLKKLDDESFNVMNRIIKIDSYNMLWQNIVYYPKELADTFLRIGKLAITAIDLYKYDNIKYWNILNEINDEYFKYINLFRKRFYFDTTDLSDMIKQKIEGIKSAEQSLPPDSASKAAIREG